MDIKYSYSIDSITIVLDRQEYIKQDSLQLTTGSLYVRKDHW